jgi:hypothetical protein
MTTENTNIPATPLPAPRMVLHVGPGLAKCRSSADPALERSLHHSETHSELSQLFRDTMEQTGVQTAPWAPGSQLLIAPEVLCTEAQATIDVLRTYAAVRAKPGAVLGVMTFSYGLIQTLLNALVTADVHLELVVCLHYEDRAPTVHRMDKEGFLEDWPYGILDANVDEDTLLELGFDVPHKR